MKIPISYKEYVKNANRYMETHWQFNNHLDHPRHQVRIEYTASFCLGNTLEVGCANGYSTNLMQQANPKAKFSGYELTDWAYKEAIKSYPDIKFYQGLGEFTPFKDEEFETVLLMEIIEHCKYPEILADEAWRITQKRLVITTPTKEHPDPDHKRFYPIEEMSEFLKPYGKAKFVGLTEQGQITNDLEQIYFQITWIDK